MSQYLLSLHTGEDTSHGPGSPEEAEAFMGRVDALEADLRSSGAFVFTGGLHGPDAATVVQRGDGDFVMTDGPYVEAKEHIAGFYVIEAADLDEALRWAERVVDAVRAPIEVRPFMASRGGC